MNPTTIKSVPIGECVTEIQTWNPARDCEDGTFQYIDISSVSQSEKRIIPNGEIPTLAAPSRARQLVRVGDVLVSTVRPNLNAVAFVPEELDSATASTGFCVLIPDDRRLSGRYLFHWVQSPRFIADMVKQTTGQSYPAVSDKIIKQSRIPLPLLDEQKRIAAILDQADDLRRLRQRALDRLNDLGQAKFYEMFGDPVSNPYAWAVTKLQEIGELDRGVSKHRPRNDPVLLGGVHPLIQTGDVANADGYIRNYGATYSDIGLKQSKLWKRGTLCITIAANIGKTAILDFDACFPDSVVGFTPSERATVEYVQYWLRSIQKRLEDIAPQSAQKNINLAILKGLPIPLPPISLQADFSAVVQNIEAQKNSHQDAMTFANLLFTSLQHRAFRGEL